MSRRHHSFEFTFGKSSPAGRHTRGLSPDVRSGSHQPQTGMGMAVIGTVLRIVLFVAVQLGNGLHHTTTPNVPLTGRTLP